MRAANIPKKGAADVRGVRNPPCICFHDRSYLVQHLDDQPQPNQQKRGHVGDVWEQPLRVRSQL
jgi:hypothetical protein